jgi:hypothetical protein
MEEKLELWRKTIDALSGVWLWEGPLKPGDENDVINGSFYSSLAIMIRDEGPDCYFHFYDSNRASLCFQKGTAEESIFEGDWATVFIKLKEHSLTLAIPNLP